MRGWILYHKTPDKHGVSRLVSEAPRRGLSVAVVHPESLDLVIGGSGTPGVVMDGADAELPDFALVRLGAMVSYFSMAIVRQLESLGVVVINTSDAMLMAADKFTSQQLLARHGVPTPRTVLLKSSHEVDTVARELGFPLVVKTVRGTLGRGVTLCRDEESLRSLLDMMRCTGATSDLLLQELVSPSVGKDLRVLVIDGRIVACMERYSEKGNFKANFTLGGSVRPHLVTPEIERLALRTAKLCGLDIAGIDLLFGPEGLLVCEANASPGFKGLELCFPDLNVPEVLFDFVVRRVHTAGR